MSRRTNRATLVLTPEEDEHLKSLAASRTAPFREVQRAKILLNYRSGQTFSEISRVLSISRRIVYKHVDRALAAGVAVALCDRPHGSKPTIMTEAVKNSVFALLHSPPSQHNINRTSWRLADIRQCLLAQGISVSRASISRIVRAAGHTWNMATEVLTSNDPAYQEKLERIKSVLSTLGENDRFCSISG